MENCFYQNVCKELLSLVYNNKLSGVYWITKGVQIELHLSPYWCICWLWVKGKLKPCVADEEPDAPLRADVFAPTYLGTNLPIWKYDFD